MLPKYRFFLNFRIVLFVFLFCSGCSGQTLSRLEESATKQAQAAQLEPHDRKSDVLLSRGMPERDCLAFHIKEAIELNTERLDLYSKVSGGRSIALSEKLIESEKNVLRVSSILDKPAQMWQVHGVPVGCIDFVSMSETPPFQVRTAAPPVSFERLKTEELWSLVVRLKIATKKSYEKSLFEVHEEILEFRDQKEYHCMKRHILESIARSIYLLPIYEKLSASKLLISPRGLMTLYIEAQITSLFLADEIDNMAAPLQGEGIAIICNDVPPIPYGPLSQSH